MRYLLGDLSEDERTRLEESFFVDDAQFESLEFAEDELIDTYVRNTLSPEKQKQFRAKLLTSPRLQERVNFARALMQRADSFLSPEAEQPIEPAPLFSSAAAVQPRVRRWSFFGQQPAWGVALAACVLLVVGSVVLFSGWLHNRNESKRLASELAALQQKKTELDKLSRDQQTKAEQLTAELQHAREEQAKAQQALDELQQTIKSKEPEQSSLNTFATLFLTPGMVRGGGGVQSKLTIGPQTTTATVGLALLKNDYRSYNVEIRTIDDEKLILRRSNLKPHHSGSGTQLLLTIPSRSLPPDDYKVHVDGVNASGRVEGVDDYQFRVVNKSK
jgi:outer membrane murein-binding lipoprotein Lpp